jgi:phosphoribosylaminoimidazole (AIR) synthetase
MLRTFNCGVGMILAGSRRCSGRPDRRSHCRGRNRPFTVGEIVAGRGKGLHGVRQRRGVVSARAPWEAVHVG